MSELYRQWWQLGKSKQEALMLAQRMLRLSRDKAGRPRFSDCDWAGWLLVGE